MAALRGITTKFAALQINAFLPKISIHNVSIPASRSSLSNVVPACVPLSRNLRSSTTTNVVGTNSQFRQTLSQLKQEIVEDPAIKDEFESKDIVEKVNALIKTQSHGRLFAVIHMSGSQFRVTDGDLIMMHGNSPLKPGDVIRLEKVLLVGSSNFTLLGRPILRPDLVRVEATVVDKSLSHTVTHFRKKRRKQYMRINFYRIPYCVLRINCVQLEGLVDQRPEVEGVDGRVF